MSALKVDNSSFSFKEDDKLLEALAPRPVINDCAVGSRNTFENCH